MHNHDQNQGENPEMNNDQPGEDHQNSENTPNEADSPDGSFDEMMANVDGDPAADDPAKAEGDDAGAKIAALEAELDQAKDQMMRALADAENTRRRGLKDREDIRKYAVAEFARDLLDFSDNFGRALESLPKDLMEADERLKNVLTGIQAMESTLMKTFEKHGIKKIEPMDELFNPNFHEVMFEAPATGKAAGTIVQVIEPGYVVADRLLRPARVGIAKDEGQGGAGNGNGDNIDTSA